MYNLEKDTKNNTFITYIVKHGLAEKWAPALDWYLSPKHFEHENWKTYISVFTKRIKRLDYLKNVEIKYGKEGTLTFPAKTPKSTRIILEQTSKDSKSVGKDFVRHIRNGIAHGRAKFLKIRDDDFVEIKDYSDDKQTRQTAYILVHRDCLISIYDLYLDIKKRVEK